MNQIASFVQRHALAAFFVLVFALEGVATLLLAGDPTTLPFALVLIPTVVALPLAAVTEDRAGVKTLLRRVVRWRVGPQWYAVVLGVPLIGSLAMVGLAVLLGAPTAELFKTSPANLLIVLAIAFIPALLEEIGWRGYALPKMLPGRSALSAGLILGVIWSAFHLPLYLPGQMYDGLPVWSVFGILVSYSVLLTWVFKGTRGSVLLVTLFHAMLNGSTPLTNGIDPVQAWVLRAVVFAGIALVVIAVTGPNLTREKSARIEHGEQTAVIVEQATEV